MFDDLFGDNIQSGEFRQYEAAWESHFHAAAEYDARAECAPDPLQSEHMARRSRQHHDYAVAIESEVMV